MTGLDRPSSDKICGDCYSIVIPDDNNLRDTIIPENTYPSSNNILESRDLVLSSLHIYDVKYSIYSRKTEMATKIMFHKVTESIESMIILEVTDDKGLINLLINVKFIVTVVDHIFLSWGIPPSTNLVLCETNVRDSQYKTKTATYQYL